MEIPRVPFRNQVQPDPKLNELAQKRAAAEAKKLVFGFSNQKTF